MRIKAILSLITLLALLAWSCGEGRQAPPPGGGGGGSDVTIFVGDAPPDGVTILSFQITITGAVLNPGNVSLVSDPIDIELKRLETELAFLNTVNVPTGTYTSITVTFSNPRITFKNDTGATLAGCPTGQVCQFNPPLGPAMVEFNGPPFPITIQLNQPVGLLIDFDLLNSLAANLSVSPTITLQVLPPLQGTGEIEDLDDLVGRVLAINAAGNEFTLELTFFDQSLTIRVDQNTEFDDFGDASCAAEDFSCLEVGQIVEVDLLVLAGGVLLAEEVELAGDDDFEELEGIVVSVASDTQFQMVIINEIPDVAGVGIGTLVTVNIEGGAEFRIDEDGLTIPPGLSFASGADLLVGQTVQVRRREASDGTIISTDRVRLRRTRFTAFVKVPGAVNFTIDNLPSLFTSNGIIEIEVFTSAETDFDDVDSPSALSIGDRVSLRGLLFKRLSGIPALVAKKVRKRD